MRLREHHGIWVASLGLVLGCPAELPPVNGGGAAQSSSGSEDDDDDETGGRRRRRNRDADSGNANDSEAGGNETGNGVTTTPIPGTTTVGDDGQPVETVGAETEGGETEVGDGTTGSANEGPTTRVYILFGQSNMWGVPPPGAEDMVTNPRVEVLTLTSCGSHGTNQWVTAAPPLHGCVGSPSGAATGPGLGPGDYFARTLAAAYPNDTILLVPASIPGVSIDVFAPGQQAYQSMVSRAQMAQQRGEIRGIIFHQGETDTGSPTWPGRVAAVVSALKQDLGIGDVPFLAGELPTAGCCGTGHNGRVGELDNGAIPNAHIVQAAELPVLGDGLHFTTTAQRTLGTRYGEVMLQFD